MKYLGKNDEGGAAVSRAHKQNKSKVNLIEAF